MYLNGVRVGTASTQSGGPLDDAAPLTIGPSYSGKIDEIAIDDHVLTAERVQAHIAAAAR